MADQTFAVNCGFFDAINSDRTYSADEMNRPYRRVISNGVFATPQGNPSTDLQVVESTGMNIICKAGEGLFADKWFENPSSIVITVPNNTATVPRIDSVLVQVDTRTSGRVGNIVHRTGTPASSPVPPAINQTEGVVEYRLANVRVNPGVTSIMGRYITDRRGSSDCPWVTSLIYQVDTSTLYDQWQAAYAEYFEEEKAIWDAWYAQLTEDLDVSMTLDRHVNTVTTTPQTTGYIPIGLAYNHNTDILEVYINGLRAVEGTHYVVVDDTTILVENQLDIGQAVTFVVMRSVISGSATNIMVLLQELESQIAGIAGGTPTVVDSASDMTDTEKIYILSSDSKWYYYSATAEDWLVGGTYGGVPTDTTLAISGAPADAKAVGDALSNITIEVDDTLTEQGKAADAKAVGDAIAEKADIADVTNLDNRVTAIESNSGSDYKTPDKSKWTFGLSADDSRITVLSNNRASANGDASVNGYTTYLVPNEVIADKGAFMPIAGTRYFTGYYLQNGASRTYTSSVDYLTSNDDYTGIVICMQDSKGGLDANVFFNKIEVITKHSGLSDIAGFSGYETTEYMSFNGTNQSYLIECFVKVEAGKVYAIDLSNLTINNINAVLAKNGTSAFSITSQEKHAIMGDWYIIPSIDGYISFRLRPDSNKIKMYESDGIKMLVLDKPEEIRELSRTVPCRAYVHAGNFLHQVMLAYAMGWRGVEADVRKTSDGVFVFSHDDPLAGMSIADNTYATLKTQYPALMTLEELIRLSVRFGCGIMYHFSSLSADDRWEIMRLSKQRGVEYLGYSIVSSGNIGSEPVATFWKHGYYTWGASAIPDNIEQAQYNIGGTYNAEYPQTGYYMKAHEDGSGYVVTNNKLNTDYSDYFSELCYLNKYCPLYDAKCSSLALDKETMTITTSGVKKIYPSPKPIYCSGDIVWSTSDASVATVAASASNYTLYPYANITPVGNGTCIITATINGVSASCEVTINIA